MNHQIPSEGRIQKARTTEFNALEAEAILIAEIGSDRLSNMKREGIYEADVGDPDPTHKAS